MMILWKIARGVLAFLIAGIASVMACYAVTSLAMRELVEPSGDGPTRALTGLLLGGIVAVPVSFIVSVRAAIYAYRGGAPSAGVPGRDLPVLRRWRARAFSILAGLTSGVVVLLVFFWIMSSGTNDDLVVTYGTIVAALAAFFAEDRFYRLLLAQAQRQSRQPDLVEPL